MGNVTRWPVQFCDELGGRNVFCRNVMKALGPVYPAALHALAAAVGADDRFSASGAGALASELAGLAAQAEQMPGTRGVVTAAKQISDFVRLRAQYLDTQ